MELFSCAQSKPKAVLTQIQAACHFESLVCHFERSEKSHSAMMRFLLAKPARRNDNPSSNCQSYYRLSKTILTPRVTLAVIASEAKQSHCPRWTLRGFVAHLPWRERKCQGKPLLAMTQGCLVTPAFRSTLNICDWNSTQPQIHPRNIPWSNTFMRRRPLPSPRGYFRLAYRPRSRNPPRE